MLKERVTIDAVSKLGFALEADLKNMLEYYGETPDSPDSPKPEDFFALILSFSSSLQVTCPPFYSRPGSREPCCTESSTGSS